MELINNLDGRIFEFSLSSIFDGGHLFDPRPQTFYFVSWAFLFGILGVIASIVMMWWFKKRRDKFYVGKFSRKIFGKHAKISLIIWIIYILFVLLRTQGFAYLSMPFWLYFLILIQIGNGIWAVVKSKKESTMKEGEGMAEAETSSENYYRYLPKKKKK